MEILGLDPRAGCTTSNDSLLCIQENYCSYFFISVSDPEPDPERERVEI